MGLKLFSSSFLSLSCLLPAPAEDTPANVNNLCAPDLSAASVPHFHLPATQCRHSSM